MSNILNIRKKNKSVQSYNFDWDDNIMFMPTQIILFHKETRKELAISTHEFAQVRQDVGASGIYKDYELLNVEEDPCFSYREFRDMNGVNSFLPQVMETLKNKDCYGPSFLAFQEALSNPQTAKRTSIITARGHSPESILEAIEHLQAVNLVKYLPPLENLFPVSSPRINANASRPAEMKLTILAAMIDKMEEKAKKSVEVPTFSGFSDDDLETYKLVKARLLEYAKAGRWKHVKIVLYFTGKNPETKILTPNGYVDYKATQAA